MQLCKPEEYKPDLGRVLTEEERLEAEKLYPWPRPDRKLCRVETTNEKWRMGRK